MLFRKKRTLPQEVVRERTSRSEDKLRKYAFTPIEEIYQEFDSGVDGITDEVAEERLEEVGKNVIEAGQQHGPWYRLMQAFVNPFNIVLFAVALITFISDIVIEHSGDWTTIVIILVLVFVSSMVSFVQGERSNKAAEDLIDMISNKTDVFRQGRYIEIPLEEAVPGDIVRLAAGDIVPGDVRFITTKDAFIAQSALTGESNPVEKYADIRNEEDDALTDLTSIGFMGSNMVSGSALAIILYTGNHTYFGAMAKTLSGDRSKNAFEKGVESVSHLLIRLMMIMVPVIFLINGFTKGDWADSLLFAVTIAVGLTPEMLPMIMTSTLARGAVAMSKHQVIVKSTSSIQTFGEMDVLCTDKTGTLTEDKIVLERYMNVMGQKDQRILRHAFLNSHFQTGLKNLIDKAIISRAEESGLQELIPLYHKVDEIPFDFARRRMSVVLADQTGKTQLITKGAVDEIISICKYIEYEGEVLPITEDLKARAMNLFHEQSKDGLRIIAVAQKNEVAGIDVFDVEHESDMVLLGFVGFFDPPKESSADAIEALKVHGVRVVVLTGDSEGVAKLVCDKVGVKTKILYNGTDVDNMNDMQLKEAVEVCDLFAKLSPIQKERVVAAFQHNGHTVGYMGDGINDAPALRQADVGISVDSAVDIAKETAEIILLKKDLMVLEEGVIEGRRAFGNLTKYLKMAVSGNFGNMFSVIAGSIFLPFLPMLPLHILVQNLLCDFAQLGIPFDKVDNEYILEPRKWDTKGLTRFMLVFGPLSSIFDIACFAVMWWAMDANSIAMSPLFQCGWFVFGTLSQVLIVHVIRTSRVPFVQSMASWPFMLSTIVFSIVPCIIGFTGLAVSLDFMTLPLSFAPYLAALVLGYCVLTEVLKRVYIRIYDEWL